MQAPPALDQGLMLQNHSPPRPSPVTATRV